MIARQGGQLPVCSDASACHICPQVILANRSSRSLVPRPGGGGTFEACGQERAGERWSGENEKKRACFHRSFRPPVCLPLSRPTPRSRLTVFSIVSFRPSRLFVSLSVCLFLFPPCGVSLIVSPYLVSLFTSRPSYSLLVSFLHLLRPFIVVVRVSLLLSLLSSLPRHPPSPSLRLILFTTPVCVSHRFPP